MNNATSAFAALYNAAYAGPISGNPALSTAFSAYNVLVSSIGGAGFHGASVSYLSSGSVVNGNATLSIPS